MKFWCSLYLNSRCDCIFSYHRGIYFTVALHIKYVLNTNRSSKIAMLGSKIVDCILFPFLDRTDRSFKLTLVKKKSRDQCTNLLMLKNTNSIKDLLSFFELWSHVMLQLNLQRNLNSRWTHENEIYVWLNKSKKIFYIKNPKIDKNKPVKILKIRNPKIERVPL